MRYLILAAAAAIATASLPAYAGTNSTTAATGTTPPAATAPSPWDLTAKEATAARGQSAQLRAELKQAGFTDIHIMPTSFLVRAKNKEGMSVMMVVNPDSITAVTAMNEPNGGSAGNSGSSATTKEQPGTAEGSAKMQGSNEPHQVNSSGTSAGSASNASGTSTTKTE